MTKIIKILGLIAFVLITACKKDDDTIAKFTILSETSLDFEYGQSKEVLYSTEKIKGFRDPEVPEGWSCAQVDGRYLITSPSAGNTNAALSGDVKLTALDENDLALTRTIKVAVKIAQEITQPANCYVVSEPNTRYKFNARRRGSETAETLTDAAGAYRLWSTSSVAIINVSYEGGDIYFSTGEADKDTGAMREANALIVVTDVNGKILWSWHIWATEDDPALAASTIGGYMVMDRNLGAFTTSTATEDDVLNSYGLLYQWGRKDPFTGPDAWDSTTPLGLYGPTNNYDSHSFEVSTAEIGTFEHATMHPSQFIAGVEDNDFDWLFAGGRDNTSWSAVQNPCPAGWQVAPSEIWEAFFVSSDAMDTTDPADFKVEGEYVYGWTFALDSGDSFWPGAGRRNYSPSMISPARNYTNVVNGAGGLRGYPVGFYWSNNSSESLSFTKDDIMTPQGTDTSTVALAGGFSVRCVKKDEGVSSIESDL